MVFLKDTKGGYGICMDSKAAEAASKSDWFDCKTPSFFSSDPYDTSCLAASLQGDAASCEATLDANGGTCEWCTVGSTSLCLDADQAEIAEQIGGDCNSPPAVEAIGDPYDTACLAASMEGDEATCEATVDQNGEACAWCTVGSTDLCLNPDQADIAKQIGGDCKVPPGVKAISDPYDTSCLAASLQGDAASCEATLDANGGICEWCTVGSTSLCLDAEQAEIAEQVGGDCNSPPAVEAIGDPYDTACLAASMEGDEATCEATVDQNGEACAWCTVGSTDLCLNPDQAEIAQQVGGSCANRDELLSLEY